MSGVIDVFIINLVPAPHRFHKQNWVLFKSATAVIKKKLTKHKVILLKQRNRLATRSSFI